MTEPLGVIEVSDDVIRSIVQICSHELPGVACVSEESIINGAFKMLRSADSPKGIRIVNGHDDRAKKVDVSIQVEYGVAIPAVAGRLQTLIKEQVERIAGVGVEEVNIHIDGVQVPADPSAPPRLVGPPEGPGAVQETPLEEREPSRDSEESVNP